MHYNINILDGVLRMFGACIFAAFCGWQGWWIGVLAVYPIVTAMSGWDPLYDVFGFSTRKDHSETSRTADVEEGGTIVQMPHAQSEAA